MAAALITAVLFSAFRGDKQAKGNDVGQATVSDSLILQGEPGPALVVEEPEEAAAYEEAASYTELVEQLMDAVTRGNTGFVQEKLLYGSGNGTWEQFDGAEIERFVRYLNENDVQRENLQKKLSEGASYSASDSEGRFFVLLPLIYCSITTDMEETAVTVEGFDEKQIGTQDTLTQGPLLPMEYTVAASNASWELQKEKKINVDLTMEEIPVAFTSGEESVHTGGHIVAIDAGHQAKADTTKEPIGPGASETKARVAGGTTGVSTGLREYELTLSVANKLKQELISRGYEVVMIRESHDVNISNSARAEIANAAEAEAFVRIHANGAEDSSVSGALTMAPSLNNPYCASIAQSSQALSEAVLQAFCEATGARNRGVSITDTMSGINWCQVPVTIVEMGFMSNPAEDEQMAQDDYQNRMAGGIADGLDRYFSAPAQ